jgi:hypothetical protein
MTVIEQPATPVRPSPEELARAIAGAPEDVPPPLRPDEYSVVKPVAEWRREQEGP